MKIAFVNGKGGVGKSTLCYLMALALREAGKEVGILDRDPQETLAGIIRAKHDDIGEAGEFLLIDTAPNLLAEEVAATIKEADRIVIPCTPDPFALPVTISSAQAIAELKRKKAKAFVVLNQMQSGTKLGIAAPAVLRKALSLPMLNTEIGFRHSIKRVSAEGWGKLDREVKESVLKLALEVIS